MRKPRPLTPAELDSAKELRTKLQNFIEFDAYVIGTGVQTESGTVAPLSWHASSRLPRDFLDKYAAVADDDSANVLFASSSDSAFSINVQTDYPHELPKTGEDFVGYHIGSYLREANIKHLLIFGIQSSLGEAQWMTLYRMGRPADIEKPVEPFSAEDVEKARYIGQGSLFEWQWNLVGKSKAAVKSQREIPLQPFKLAKLRKKHVAVAVLMARGLTAKEIAQEIGGSERTIQRLSTDVLEAFAPGDKSRRFKLAANLHGPIQVRKIIGSVKRK